MPLQSVGPQKKKEGGLVLFYQHLIPTGFQKMLFVFQPLRGGILVAKKPFLPLFFGGRSGMSKRVSQEGLRIHNEGFSTSKVCLLH